MVVTGKEQIVKNNFFTYENPANHSHIGKDAQCKDAFRKPNDTNVQVACQANNVSDFIPLELETH